jgi:hypothetical protein
MSVPTWLFPGALRVSAAMPTFYFHLHSDIDAPDDEGKVLPDIDAARAYAEASVVDLMAATLKEKGRINLRHHLDIEDGQGKVLATVRFRDVVAIEG